MIRSIIVAASLLCVSYAAQAQGMFINPFEERSLGQQGHKAALEKSGGLYQDKVLADYVAAIGSKAAHTTARHPEAFVFSLTADPELNAFARMGGFIYINVGALVWINDEAELAALLGHEVGHATSRHMAHYINRKNVATGLTRLSRLRRGATDEDMKEKKVKATLLLLEYGRDNEYESDDIAFSAVVKMGLDPMGTPRMLNQLVNRSNLFKAFSGENASEKETPDFLRSHPPSVDRVRRSLGKVSSLEDVANSKFAYRDRYLDAIDGISLPGMQMTGAEPSRLTVISVQPGDTLESLGDRMVIPGPPGQLTLMAINGLNSEADLKAGMRLKLLVGN